MYKFDSSCGFQQGDKIGIASSNCRHCTLSNSIMCSDSYPIPILSLFFLCHPYIPYFLLQRICYFLVSFLFYCMHACTVIWCTTVLFVWPPDKLRWLFLFILKIEKFFELKSTGYRDSMKRKEKRYGWDMSYCT